MAGGLLARRMDARGVRTREEFVARARAVAAGLQGGEWLLGSGWDEGLLAGGERPTRAWLDEAVGDVPALVWRFDLHSAVVSSAALAAAGLTAASLDPPGGALERDASSGELTGMLIDEAVVQVSKLAPPPSKPARREAVAAATRLAAAQGATLVCDLTDFQGDDDTAFADLLGTFAAAADAGELRARVFAYAPLRRRAALEALVAERGYAHGERGMVSWGGLKAFYDGSLGSRSALFKEPYADGVQGERGLNVTDLAWLRREAAAAAVAGLSVAVHAISDQAAKEVADVLASLPLPPRQSTAFGPGMGKHRVEHLQHWPAEWDAEPALAAETLRGLAVSVQPTQYSADAPTLEARLGAQRAGRAFALRSATDAGAELLLGSDWPVVPLDPLGAVRAAVQRGGGEDITADAALRASLAAPLEQGGWADFVLLDNDPLAWAARQETDGEAEERKPRVLRTYIGGALVHSMDEDNESGDVAEAECAA